MQRRMNLLAAGAQILLKSHIWEKRSLLRESTDLEIKLLNQY